LSGLGLNFLLASASFTHSHTLSLDSYCRPTAGKSSSPAGLKIYCSICVRVLFIGTQFSILYTSMYSPAEPRLRVLDVVSLRARLLLRILLVHTGFQMSANLSRLRIFSATSAKLGLGVGLGLGLNSLAHFSSHALPFFSPHSFHTLFLFPGFTSVWWSD